MSNNEDIMQKVGRPLKFDNVENLQKQINKYFKSITRFKWVDVEQRNEKGEILKDNTGKTIFKPEKQYFYEPKPSITGLAVFLDTSRETLMDYEGKPEFSDTIKRAKEQIQAEYEQSLIKRGNAGDIFALKNFGWKDKQEIDANIRGNIAIEKLFDNVEEQD